MVDALLQYAAELAPELQVAVALHLLAVGFDLGLTFLGEFFEQSQGLLHDLLLDEARGRILLQHFARDIERQVFAIDDAAHEAQPFGQDLLRVIHDEHALHEQSHAALLLVDQVLRRLLGDEQQARQLVRALDFEVRPRQRVIPVMARVLVELDVLLLGDLALRPSPDRAGGIDRLPFELLVVLFAALHLQSDRPPHIVAVLANDRLNRPILEVLLGVVLEVQHDVRATAGTSARFDFVVALGLALPDPRVVTARLA